MGKNSAIVLSFIFLMLAGCGKDVVVNPEFGTFTDPRDNMEYKWVKIGDQTWMAQNLAYLPIVHNVAYGEVTSPYYYVYNDYGESASSAKANSNYLYYGVLYNQEAAKTACPKGWHLPTDDEWKILETNLGMNEKNADGVGWRLSGSVGLKLKAATGWNNSGNGTDTSGFAAFPGGYRSNKGEFAGLGNLACFLTSTEGGANGGWCWGRLLRAYQSGVYRSYDYESNAYSVRCVRD